MFSQHLAPILIPKGFAINSMLLATTGFYV